MLLNRSVQNSALIRVELSDSFRVVMLRQVCGGRTLPARLCYRQSAEKASDLRLKVESEGFSPSDRPMCIVPEI